MKAREDRHCLWDYHRIRKTDILNYAGGDSKSGRLGRGENKTPKACDDSFSKGKGRTLLNLRNKGGRGNGRALIWG